jgi:tartronate-semialdehyde synthase
LVEVARERKSEKRLPDRTRWVAEVQKRKRTMLRRSDFKNTPIKPQRVFHEINQAFDRDNTCFVSSIGLGQIASGQFQKVFRPRNYIICGQAGPLGWIIPAAIGVKLADPSKEVVGIGGDYDFQFLIEELAVGAQFNVPVVFVLINNSYLGLIRQAQKGYKMNYEVQLSFRNINSPELGEYGVDFVKVSEGLGCKALRVFDPEKIQESIQAARKQAAALSVPVVVEVITERVTDIAMGPEIDKITEFEEVIDVEEPEEFLEQLAA